MQNKNKTTQIFLVRYVLTVSVKFGYFIKYSDDKQCVNLSFYHNKENDSQRKCKRVKSKNNITVLSKTQTKKS